MHEAFRKFAAHVAELMGAGSAFMVAVVGIVAWAASGPLFGFSNTWQLVINTSTTIITFLMVFLIQNTQSRDTKSIQLKLDELIRATSGARNSMIDLSRLSDEQLKKLEQHYLEICDAEPAPAE